MKRKDAIKAAIKAVFKITGQLCQEYSKRVGLIIAATFVILIIIALIKPNFYKDIDK